ncbi:hypothetical protein ECZU51_58570 [Escherichia coli]|nr:hypothetical protein ECZU51_58570 [Escherichia coli]
MIGDHRRKCDGKRSAGGVQQPAVFHPAEEGRVMTLFPEGGHQARGFCGPDKNTLLADDMTDGIRPGSPS